MITKMLLLYSGTDLLDVVWVTISSKQKSVEEQSKSTNKQM